MRIWHLWWHTLIWSSQYNPPKFVETLMSLLAIALLVIWHFSPKWQYSTLGLSYVIGVAASMWIREAIAPAPHHVTQVMAVMLLIFSIYCLVDLIYYL